MSQGMDSFLAAYYGTTGTASPTETDKVAAAEQEASFELFAKVAAAEGIDLTKMSDEQVMALYTKVASDEGPPEHKEEGKEEEEKEKKEKEAAAKAELAAKTAAATGAAATPEGEAQEKIAEADFLGRVMAHAYVQEMKKIAEAGTATETDPAAAEKTAADLKVRNLADKFRAGVHGAKAGAKSFAEKIKEHAGKAADKTKEPLHKAHVAVSKGMDTAKETAKKHPGKALGAAGAAGAAAGGTGGFMAGKEKKGSALDELAAERAMAKVAEAGWDVDQGAELLANLVTSGASEENTKIAAANGDLEGALEIRALELLEQCGYTVNWN
jgi:hypothetical protein